MSDHPDTGPAAPAPGPVDLPVEVTRALVPLLHPLARRWVAESSANPADAIVFDSITTMCVEHDLPVERSRLGAPISAVSERRLQRGSETITAPFEMPVTLTDALLLLHRYARRYADGRGTTAARDVNHAARTLQEHGLDLHKTAAEDGTVWATDGVGGDYDGLSADERAHTVAARRSHARR